MTRKDYKVYGDKVHKYYVTINAESQEIAWDAAAAMSSDQWFELETDDTIEPFSIEEYN
jgi:hypothetical protein